MLRIIASTAIISFNNAADLQSQRGFSCGRTITVFVTYVKTVTRLR